MIIKTLVVLFTVIVGAFSESNYPNKEGALTLEDFLKFIELAPRLQGLEGGRGRRLQGESIIKDFISNAVGDNGKSPYGSCKELFDAFDANDDGLLSQSELAAMFRKLTGSNSGLARALSLAVIKIFDTSKDGYVNLEELEAACKGDPHFVTWYGSHFSYHGACDLVLVNNPYFASGNGLDIHVRTSHMLEGQFSYVSNAAVRVGNDVLEVIHDGSHFLNGIMNAELPAKLGGFDVVKRVEQVCRGQQDPQCYDLVKFEVIFMDNNSISIKVASAMVHVDLKGNSDNFLGSVGLMGTYPAQHHGKIARDGETFIRDPDVFAQEWQVQQDEPKLFQEYRYPQHPQLCIPPITSSNTSRNLRSEADNEARKAAEEACSHVEGNEWEFCVFDVMATGDYGMAATVYGQN